jgi:DtxR family Mn-dependent transcriptional regulator
MVSPAIDDYLKTVYAHTEWQDAPITPSVLAAKLGIAPSSVTEMVKKLSTQGLVVHEPYRAVRLTAEGERRALEMVRRHRLIETWLVVEHGYTWDEVHEEAEVLEHAMSDRLLEKIDERLGRPHFDPHGDPIPDSAGLVRDRGRFVLLGEAPLGHAGRILRVSDRDPGLLRLIERAGIAVGQHVRVTATGLEVAGTRVELPAGAAEVIWLSA